MHEAGTSRRRIATRALPTIWIAIGICALGVAGVGAAQYRLALARAPLLHGARGLVVDSSGRLYCGVASSRVHVYDAEGRIVRVWPVESDGGRFRLRLAEGSPTAVVEVATERTGLLLAYDQQGEVVSRVEDPTAFERFGEANDRSFTSPSGTTWAFEGSALVRREAAVTRVVVPPIPVPLRWFAGAPWLLVALFLVGPIGIFGGLVQRGRIAPRPDRPVKS